MGLNIPVPGRRGGNWIKSGKGFELCVLVDFLGRQSVNPERLDALISVLLLDSGLRGLTRGPVGTDTPWYM